MTMSLFGISMLLLFKTKLPMLNKNRTAVVFLNDIYRQFKTRMNLQ